MFQQPRGIGIEDTLKSVSQVSKWRPREVISDWCQYLKSPVASLAYRVPEPSRVSQIPSLSHSISLLCFFLSQVDPAPSAASGTSRLVSCTLATSVSPSNTQSKSQDRASMVHLGHKPTLNPVTEAMMEWNRLRAQIHIRRSLLKLGMRERKSHPPTPSRKLGQGMTA